METNLINKKQNNVKSVLVTKIEFLNGETTELYTAIPHGIVSDFINIGISESLKMQTNIRSFESVVLSNVDGSTRETCFYSKVILSELNRKPIPEDIMFVKMNYGIS